MAIDARSDQGGDEGDAAAALDRAARAWALAGLTRRLHAVSAMGRRLVRERERLLDALRSDGLSTEMAEFWAGWILRASEPALLERYARMMARFERARRGPGGELLVRRPDGVVLLVLPANAPTINAASLFSMLLVGNGLVVRAPEHDAGVRYLVERVVQPELAAEGFDPRLATVATGKSRDVMARWAPSPVVTTVVFFGNAKAGADVAQLAAQHRKKVVLELEGSDSMLVWRGAPVERAVASALRAFHASTQPCPVPKHFFVEGALFEPFVDELVTRARGVRPVAADRDHGLLVPVARPDAYFAALEELQRVEGAEVRCGGHFLARDGSRSETPTPLLAPTVVTLPLAACRRPLRCFDEEIAFPLLPVVRCDGEDALDEALALLARSPFGLRVSAWSSEAAVLARVVQAIARVGLVVLNDDHTRVPEIASPWGGPGRSGGPHGENHFFWEKTSRLQSLLLHGASDGELAAVWQALGLPPELLPKRTDPM